MLKNGMHPVHPGEVLLEDYIKPSGIRVSALSKALHIPYPHLREIVNGNRQVTTDTALRLERYFGSEAQGWLNLQAAYDLRVAEETAGRSSIKKVRPMAAPKHEKKDVRRPGWTEAGRAITAAGDDVPLMGEFKTEDDAKQRLI